MTGTSGRVLRAGWRRWWLPISGAVVLALAGWSRAPALSKVAPARSEGVARREADAALALLGAEVRHMVERLERAAESALEIPAAAEAAFDELPGARAGDPEWGLVLYERDIPVAWSGRVRIRTDTVRAPLGVMLTPFYTIVTVTRARSERRAVAVTVVQAAPPADRLAEAISERVAARSLVAGFTVRVPPAPGRPLLNDESGRPLLVADAVPLSGAELQLRTAQRWRERIAIAFGIVLLVFLAVAWRAGSLSERLAAVAVGLAGVAIVPFNTFSAHSAAFDPAYYFTAAGGPWSANAGVLSLTAVLILLGVLALVRGKRRVRREAIAAVLGLAVLAAGVLLVGALAEGIGQPARGATVKLWLSWQVPLFLFSLAVLLTIGWLFDTALRRRRSLSRRGFLASAIAAGTVAAALVWLTTVGQRIRLAENDVVALQRGADEYLETLLNRFAASLHLAPPPRDRIDLLRAYASSDLTVAGYPFAIASWTDAGAFRARVDLTQGLDDSALVAPMVARARITGLVERAVVPGPLGAVWITAVPGSDGSVTTITAAPRSRLIEPNPYAPLLGIPGPPVDEPAYDMTITEGEIPHDVHALRWGRIGDELHADAPLRTSAGLARAHLEIDLRAPGALAQRLVLAVLFDLAVAATLLLLVRAAERDFTRRARVRLRHWTGSFRARLTLALFGFFMLPAAAFAVWGYRRLASDNRHSRELVVRETLHAAGGVRGEEPLSVIGRRLGTPLFAYTGGLLSSASDSLLDVLAPLGRALPPAVHLSLNVADELSASWEEHVGGVPVLTGYRSSEFRGQHAVLAAPARRDDATLARRTQDLTVLLLFAIAVGALAALWLSGVAARQFGRPIAALRGATRAVARGDRRPPRLPRAPSEFEPVFAAFRRMAADLERSRIESARAERVLAWGEMARQVAHEIKNPLTPMRLGLQYLQRARRDSRVNFDEVFEENSTRMLAEIDRLDEIARAFSRYGSVPAELPPARPVEVVGVLRDLIEFEKMGATGVTWRLAVDADPCVALARGDELREVLLNVFENARAAGSTLVAVAVQCLADTVRIIVTDDGSGIAPDVLPRIFEPHFSTRTTGSGLGLAISRRLLDAWGGEVTIRSEPSEGTVVTIRLVKAIAISG